MLHPPEFCHWLQGVLDTTAGEGLTEAQVSVIKMKLDDVFTHVVPVTLPTPRPASPRINPPGAHHRDGFVAKC